MFLSPILNFLVHFCVVLNLIYNVAVVRSLQKLELFHKKNNKRRKTIKNSNSNAYACSSSQCIRIVYSNREAKRSNFENSGATFIAYCSPPKIISPQKYKPLCLRQLIFLLLMLSLRYTINLSVGKKGKKRSVKTFNR